MLRSSVFRLILKFYSLHTLYQNLKYTVCVHIHIYIYRYTMTICNPVNDSPNGSINLPNVQKKRIQIDWIDYFPNLTKHHPPIISPLPKPRFSPKKDRVLMMKTSSVDIPPYLLQPGIHKKPGMCCFWSKAPVEPSKLVTSKV